MHKIFYKRFFLAIMSLGLITPNIMLASNLPVFDKELEFKLGGNGVALLNNGWHTPEGSHTWSSAQYATIDLAQYRDYLFNASRMQIILNTSVVFPFSDVKNVNVTLQGKAVKTMQVNGQGKHVLWLPQLEGDKMDPSATLLRFEIPNYQSSPALLKMSDDDRMLGIAFTSMMVKLDLDCGEQQKLFFNNGHGIQTVQIIPTVGDGDCLSHAAFTEGGETYQVVQKKAAGYRQNFCQLVNDGQFLEPLKALVYEDFIDILSVNPTNKVVPDEFKTLIREKDEYATMFELMRKFKVEATVPLQTPEARYPVETITEKIKPENVKQFVERFRKVGGVETYIPFRQADTICPAEIFARLAGKQINIFTFNNQTKSLNFIKKVGTTGPTVNILHSGVHYVRLMDLGNLSHTEQAQCNQIYMNFLQHIHDVSETYNPNLY